MEEQLNLIKNTHFSVLLVDRTNNHKAFNYNIKGRKILSIDEVKNAYSVLKFYNQNKKNDIYIKAEQGDFYNIIIDDVNSESLSRLLNCLHLDYVLLSSTNNYQCLINVNKSDYTLEQVNHLVIKLNKTFGDPNFAGANHYFRLAGFFNKKPSNNNEKTKLISFINLVQKNANVGYFGALLQDFKNTDKNHNNFFDIIIDDTLILSDEKLSIAQKEVKAEIALCKRKFTVLDWSAIDFRIVKRLYKVGFNQDEIAISMVKFTDFEERHQNSKDYLTRTISKAINNYK